MVIYATLEVVLGLRWNNLWISGGNYRWVELIWRVVRSFHNRWSEKDCGRYQQLHHCTNAENLVIVAYHPWKDQWLGSELLVLTCYCWNYTWWGENFKNDLCSFFRCNICLVKVEKLPQFNTYNFEWYDHVVTVILPWSKYVCPCSCVNERYNHITIVWLFL